MTTETRIALVTGASSGIGRAVAQRLSREGLRVALTGRRRDELLATAEICPAPTLAIPADITDSDAISNLFDQIEAAWGPVNVLVANAGAAHSGRLEKTSDADWLRMLDLNVTAPFRCIRRAAPSMRTAGYGRIVAIASNAARIGEPYIAAYTASKHAVLGLVRSAAAEYATQGITVNAVCPGFVDTPMTAASIATIAATTGRTLDEARLTLERRQPIGRLITADEVAATTWFCIENGAMSGQGVNLDGGAVQS